MGSEGSGRVLEAFLPWQRRGCVEDSDILLERGNKGGFFEKLSEIVIAVGEHFMYRFQAFDY